MIESKLKVKNATSGQLFRPQSGRNSCPEVAFFGLQFGLYHVVVPLRFLSLRSVSLAALVLRSLWAASCHFSEL